MASIDSLTRPSTRTSPQPMLCHTVEGVEFWIRSAGGRPLRCVITEPALRDHFGADTERPESWLAAFALHRADIERRALVACGPRDDVHVVLVCDFTGRLKVSAGRCGS